MAVLRSEQSDFYSYRRFIDLAGDDNAATRSYLAGNLSRAIREELTGKQWELMRMYFIENRTMTEIAAARGVNVSTVSRGIARGLARLDRCLRYGARELLRESLGEGR